ncbi:MAG: TraR/DksA C4-type zinc finger protein [Patescibacteria group bacterium]
MLEQTKKAELKAKLEEERAILEEELSGIATKDPKNPENWQAKSGDTSEIEFRDDVAERLEELEDREAETLPFESRLNELKQALEPMSAGTYGICNICGQEIEVERLTANPAALTCKTHLG